LRFFLGHYPPAPEGPPISFAVTVSYSDVDNNGFETYGRITFDRVTQAGHYHYEGRKMLGQATP